MKKTFQNIYVVLTYRNSDDLIDFIKSVKKNDSKSHIIVVNSFFDEESKKIIQQISINYKCDFINVENKGYSFGNNQGIDFAIKNYNFEFLIVSNADIIINKFETSLLDNNSIHCCNIITKSGKNQNPMMVKQNRFSQFLIYKGLKKNLRILFFSGLFFNSFQRFLYQKLVKKESYKIYQPHGSFLIFSRSSLLKLKKVFDDNVFLFSEESILSKRCHELNIDIFFHNNFQIYHKEDGSVNLLNKDISEIGKKSYIYYYDHYVKKQ